MTLIRQSIFIGVNGAFSVLSYLILTDTFILFSVEYYQVQDCLKMDTNEENYTVFAKGGEWPEAGICVVYDKQEISDYSVSYSISVDLYNTKSNQGYLGIMFNAEDLDNFDFVYFRYEGPIITGLI